MKYYEVDRACRLDSSKLLKNIRILSSDVSCIISKVQFPIKYYNMPKKEKKNKYDLYSEEEK